MALDYEAVEAPIQDDPPQKTPEQVARYWLDNISAAEKKRKPFWVRGDQIVKRFKNKRTLTTLGVPVAQRRMNVLWANVQTQKPVLFAQTPKANVSRRNKTKDPVGRMASIVLQNCLQNSIAMEDFDFIMSQVVEDRLLPGAGIAMVEYVAQVEQDQVGWQAAETRYIHWKDWLTNVARVPQEVWFFAYKVYLTRNECYQVALNGSGGDEEFAADVRSEITLDHREDEKDNTNGPAKAVVWVIWDKTEKQIIQLATGYTKAPLAIMPPPVNFDDFWPCPRPLQSTTTNDSTNPTPDFEQYVDQADEIDMLTNRIGLLTKSLRMRGIYAADIDGIKELMNSNDQDLIPVANMTFLLEKGGLEKAIAWMPVEQIAQCLLHCYEARDQAMSVMYQVTGISDIMRGETEASETLGAQQLKAQFGGVRVRESQKDVQRFIRDLLRKKAEIICEHFNLQSIQAMSGVKLLTDAQKKTIQKVQQLGQQFAQAQQQWQQMAAQAQQQGMMPPPQPQTPAVLAQGQQALQMLQKEFPDLDDVMREPSWDEVMALLTNEKLRGFVVDVETDSTIEPDQQAQQQAAVAFTGAIAQFMTAALPIVQVKPEAIGFIGELLLWTVRQWKSADTIEGAVDEFVEKMEKQSEQPPPPNPQMQAEQMKAEAEVKKADASVQVAQIGVQKAQIDMESAALDHQHKQAEHGMQMQALQQEGVAQQQSAELGERQHQQAMEQAAMKPKEAA